MLKNFVALGGREQQHGVILKTHVKAKTGGASNAGCA